jgi:putative cofactor-binding repeat protein
MSRLLTPRHLGALLLLLQWSGASAFTVIVDQAGSGAYLTIQEGLNAAAASDTVLVLPGTYMERITLDTDDDGVVLMSASGPELTVIDGTGTAGQPIVVFQDCGSATQLRGFTIRGVGSLEYHDAGGGVACLSSDPIIDGSVIEYCWIYGFGGGIYLEDSGAVVSGNVVRECVAGQGGGIHMSDGAPIIVDNEIVDNEARSFYDNVGAGIYVCGGAPTIAGNLVTRNESWSLGGGIYIECSSTGGVVSSNVIMGNIASSGGGVGVGACSTRFEDNVITGNAASGWGGAVASHSPAVAAVPLFERNIITGNTDPNGAIYIGGEVFPVFTNNSLGGNDPREVWVRGTAAAGTVNMRANWWNTVDPAAIAELVYDCSDTHTVNACIDFSEWCEDPACGGIVTSVPDDEQHQATWGRLKALHAR